MSFPPEDKKEVLLAWEKSGQRQTIRIEGNSMRPLLDDGCGALVERVSGGIKLGDIVVYYQGDVLTIHRIVKVKEMEDGFFCRTKGDSSLNLDPSLIKQEEIIGRVVGVVRGRSAKNIDNRSWRIRGRIIARYSYFVGYVCGMVKFCTRPFLKDKNNALGSFAGKTLLFVLSIFPRIVSACFRQRSDKRGKRKDTHSVL